MLKMKKRYKVNYLYFTVLFGWLPDTIDAFGEGLLLSDAIKYAVELSSKDIYKDVKVVEI